MIFVLNENLFGTVKIYITIVAALDFGDRERKFNHKAIIYHMSIREVEFIRTIFNQEKVDRAVVAVSGGIDSSVALVLIVKALGAENVYILQLPYKNQGTENSDLILDFVKIPLKNRVKINIGKIVDGFGVKDRVRLGNIMARVRMIYCFDLAKKLKALVVGTENKSEKLLGYYTRFGDEAADIEPIIHLYKTEVRKLARELEIPEEIIKQKPTAGLWPGQIDEGDLGFTYKEADQVLRGKKQNIKVQQRLKQVDFKKRVPYTL
ncbi:MAG: NAD(+) synthase [Candidatus Tagabacteria bacterium CG10_big_fil_rev_8_21_14_0_10_40_13]|uniref:NH(3)-dependent NAD(+) synthetase n=1 Tax=Candidatus Tagabacteria bacterium CG10_big_fil_rev_8_21_14_0_10_40_13 TaxID=1975022 RepID=A0A2M8L9L8_9BACT|nr:MAG: NAD(+) synthase [Candidatus Tagabacteria bacterium CG10_big_fil_rev_8_21_14_0_10_40_13]